MANNVDDFPWEEGVTDVKLIVEGREIAANKGFLMSVSPYFKIMFRGGFNEQGTNEITLEEKKYTEMVEFMHFLLQDRCPDLTDEKVDFLIPLATYFQTNSLKKRCEDYLLGQYVEHERQDSRWKPLPSRDSALKHIHIGLDNKCERLKKKAKEHLSRCCLKDIDKDESFADLSIADQHEIYQMRINTVEDHYHEHGQRYHSSNFESVMLGENQ